MAVYGGADIGPAGERAPYSIHLRVWRRHKLRVWRCVMFFALTLHSITKPCISP